MTAKISISAAGKVYESEGSSFTAIENVSLDIEAGRFVVLLGPSGCGKSTLLNIIAGFDSLTSGSLLIDGRPVKGPGPDRGVVFQEFILYPWLTVLGNVRVGLDVQKRMPRAARKKLALDIIKKVGLEGFENRYPHTLSGGMKQRVAIARTLTTDPEILLMDEPFGALDAQTRGTLQRDLLSLWRGTNKTVVFVTHSVQEALLLGDDVIVFSPRPAVIREHVRVDLPRPRSRTGDDFIALEKKLMALLVDADDLDNASH